jgi:hypothetical protein
VAAPVTNRLPEPLRLPRGSVRGFIALIVTATYAYLLLQGGKPVPSVLVNSVVVVIAFYFGSRAAMAPPTTPPAPGQPMPPLVSPAPRRTKVVRALLLVVFAGLAGWFVRTSPSWDSIPADLRAILEVLAGYVAGLTVSWLVHRRAHESLVRKRFATIARDAIAAGALALTAYICFALATAQLTLFAERAVDALSLVVTFYFGSRVIGH